jgi:putative ABC transport system permease protein
MESSLRNLLNGAVTLRRNPAYSVVAILTLAVGIGASIAMFTVIQSVLLRPLLYERPEELVMLWHRYERTGADKVQIAPPDFADFRERATPMTELAAFRNARDALTTL